VDQIQELVASAILLAKVSKVRATKIVDVKFLSESLLRVPRCLGTLSVYILFVSYTAPTNHLSCRTHTISFFPLSHS